MKKNRTILKRRLYDLDMENYNIMAFGVWFWCDDIRYNIYIWAIFTVIHNIC